MKSTGKARRLRIGNNAGPNIYSGFGTTAAQWTDSTLAILTVTGVWDTNNGITATVSCAE